MTRRRGSHGGHGGIFRVGVRRRLGARFRPSRILLSPPIEIELALVLGFSWIRGFERLIKVTPKAA
jgi:hypothetical protein